MYFCHKSQALPITILLWPAAHKLCLTPCPHVQAESEARRAFLLRQAAIKRGDDPGEAQAQLPEQPASQGDDAPTGLLQHVNFFVEHEARELHPEVPLAAPSDCLQCALW